MKVLVTGGTGLIGKATIERILRRGWEVRAIGIESGVEISGAETVTCDILNYDDVRQQMRGCQAVIHLAAIPRPSLAPGEKVFAVNVSGTFNVFEAAAAEGIKRVVQASSINALGVSFSLTDVVTEYFPIDEHHPANVTDPYSLSKQIIEDIGEYYWRREGISSVALRFSGVHTREHIHDEQFLDYRQKASRLIGELAALSDTKRAALLEPVRRRVLDWRMQRPMEYRDAQPAPLPKSTNDDIPFHIYGVDRFNFWASVDHRDVAQSLEKGLTSAYDGAHAFFISDSHNWLGYESKALINIFFPHISDEKIALSGTESLLSLSTARTLIGYEPEYSLETQL